jgi:SsrA-binding protein
VADKSDKSVATNRRARFDYELVEVIEAGVVLTGSEIKSVRAGKVSLQDTYAEIVAGEAWLVNAHIGVYERAGYAGHEPRRRRKLLLHKRQIADLAFRTQVKGFTLIAVRMYLKGSRAKIEIALARGKRSHDKREAIRERETRREIDREMREHER